MRNGDFRNDLKIHNLILIVNLSLIKGHHFEIEKQGIYFFIDEGPYMMSLEQLVQHYSRQRLQTRKRKFWHFLKVVEGQIIHIDYSFSMLFYPERELFGLCFLLSSSLYLSFSLSIYLSITQSLFICERYR